MREIEFRGKRVDTGEWVYGFYYTECGNVYIIDDRQSREGLLVRNHPHDVALDAVGQYTGLKDKNGVRIFEGDIVKDENIEELGVVFWHKKHAGFYYGKYGEWAGQFISRDKFSPEENLEVIGNIHDNPDLFKDNKHDA